MDAASETESCGPSETLEDKLDSILEDEELATLLAAASGTTLPDAAGCRDAPCGDALAGGEDHEYPEVPDSSHAEPVASLADMASLALQLEAMRALAIDETGTGESSGIQTSHDSVDEDAEMADSLGCAPGLSAAGSELALVAEVASDHASKPARDAPDRQVQMVSAKRWELQRSIFRALDSDGDGRLGCTELLRFARLCGFDGSEEEWAEDYKDLCICHAGGDEGGPTLPCFRAMLNDLSDEGLHCTDKELGAVQAKIRQGTVVEPEPLPLPAPPELPLSIPLELLTPGPRVVLSAEDIPPEEGDLPAEVADSQAPPLPIEDGGTGETGSYAPDEVYDLSQMHRRDQPDVIDVEELLQNAWEAREVDGERLGDSGDEGEDEEEVETWGDTDPHPRLAADGHAGAIVPVFNRAQDEMDILAEALTTLETEMETEVATEVVGSKGSLPGGQPVLGGDSTLLDDLLVQAGVPHLAERDAAKERSKRPLQEEAAGQRPPLAVADRPAKSTRRGALRGGAPATGPSGADTEGLAALRLELLQLRTREAMEDPRAIPNLAGKVNMVHLPAVGAPKVLNTMATIFMQQDVARPHKLAILYVFHEMLLYNAHKTEFVADGAKYFLEVVGETIAHVSADKLGPFIKLLGMWRHVYTDRYLARLKESWRALMKASVARRK